MGIDGSNHNYDRNATVIMNSYESSQGTHSYTTRYTYTVPNNRNAQHTQYFALVTPKMSAAGNRGRMRFEISTDGGSTYDLYGYFQHDSTTIDYLYEVVLSTFYLMSGDIIRGQTSNTDTISHTFSLSCLCIEYNEL